jgi:transposase InsO family protein
MGHIGAHAMVNAIHGENKSWPNLLQSCVEFIKKCRECQRMNIARKGYHPMKAVHARLPGEHIAFDLAGPFTESGDEKSYLLVIVDVCTRFVLLDALPNKTALTVAKALFKRFTDIGFPSILQSDNGKEFVNEIIKTMKEQFLLDHRLVTPYHPRGNGVAENHVKSACNMIRKLIKGKQSDWDKHIPFIQLSMNTRVVSLHNSTPFSLFFARKANGFSNYTNEEGETLTQDELLDRLKYMTEIVFPAIEEKTKRVQSKMIERFNASVLLNDFPEGAKVMTIDPLKGNKLSPRYEGPYAVEKRTSHGSYILRDGTGAQLNRHFAPSQLKLVLDDFEDTITYEVEEIRSHREVKDEPGTYEYEVKWVNYPDTTWESQDNFIEQQCIIDYWDKQKARPATRRSKRSYS